MVSGNAPVIDRIDEETLGRICGAVAKAARTEEDASALVKTEDGLYELVFAPEAAISIIAEYLDAMAASIRLKLARKERLSRIEKGFLNFLRERAPCTFSGIHTSKGRRMLLPLSAAFMKCDDPPVWIQLADDISVYEGILAFGEEAVIESGFAKFTARLTKRPDVDPNYFSNLARLVLADDAVVGAG